MDNIRAILSKVFSKFEITKDVTAISDNDNLRDLGLNSLAFIYMMGEIEKQFMIVIDDDDLLIENFNTIEKIKRYIEANK